MTDAGPITRIIVGALLCIPSGSMIKDAVEDCIGLPTLADLERFPSEDIAWQAEDFADRHYNWLEGQRYYYFWDFNTWYSYEHWRLEASSQRNAWKCLRNAWSKKNSVYWRRHWLDELKEYIGPQNYEQGKMPPMVPYWRFKRLE